MIVSIDIPDHLAQVAELLIERLREELAAAGSPLIAEPGRAPAPDPLVNRPKVRALLQRVSRPERSIKTRDVVAVADVDESQFFKWQRGDYVGDDVRRRCEATVTLPAQEFLGRLAKPSRADLVGCRKNC